MSRLAPVLLAVLGLACDSEPDLDFRSDDSQHGGGGFLPKTDMGGGSGVFSCNQFTQDCPPAQKCMPWAHDGGTWNAVACFPLADDPGKPGEACTVQGGGASGMDDCERGAMCWDVDPQTLLGTCVALILASSDAPVCADPFSIPSMNGGGALTLCLPSCSPLEQACSDGQGCYPVGGGKTVRFACAPDVSGEGGGEGDVCEFINVCDPGLVCHTNDDLDDCNGSCCTPFCDVANPICALGKKCRPLSAPGAAWPGLEDAGLCVDAGFGG